MLRGDFDEIAEHIVVPDLQSLDAGFIRIACLHRGDDEPRRVAQAACLVERRVIAFAHEAAVALDQRQLVGQRVGEFLRQIARGAAQSIHHGPDFGGRVVKPFQPAQGLVGGEDAVAQASKIARAAAPHRQSRQRT